MGDKDKLEGDNNGIEFIDFSSDPERVEEIPPPNIHAMKAALIRAIENKAFDPLLKQAITGKPLTPKEEEQVLKASIEVMKLKYD